MIVVADASPLISLAILDRLDILNQLFDEVYIPVAVYHEITVNNKMHSQKLEDYARMRTYQVQDKIAVQKLLKKVDIGEAEAIVLATENNITGILIDERKGRKISKTYGLLPIGAIAILLSAKKRGLITEIKPDLDQLVLSNRRISKKLYEKALKLAGEK